MAIKLLFSKINVWERIIFIYFFLGGGWGGLTFHNIGQWLKKNHLPTFSVNVPLIIPDLHIFMTAQLRSNSNEVLNYFFIKIVWLTCVDAEYCVSSITSNNLGGHVKNIYRFIKSKEISFKLS